ncbi:MAG: mannose-1-phosphate guanylyltransferase [Bacteroidia bacterium]|nr:mannose-1-phosphate guanylyltransferase [Bacteroidia bacterium]
MRKNTYAVIMAGGIGSRFWPISRTANPKQFLDIINTGSTLIQATYDRYLKLCPRKHIYIVTNNAYKGLVKEQLKGIKDEQILCEPTRRNTAPCIAYACFKIYNINPNANIVVAPSDHIILKENDYLKIIKSALQEAASNEFLITLGIKPSRPDTGYGYIQYVSDGNKKMLFKVKTFTEKPDLELAKSFVKSGDFLWNSGIFVWNVKTILNAFQDHLPEVHDLFNEQKFYNNKKEVAYIKKAYSHCTNISIDYGIMEKSNNVYVVPAEFGWSDVGTWGAVYELQEKDYLENAVSGKNVMIYDTSKCVVKTPKDKLVILQGLEDYIVVESDDILLICKKDFEQQIKQVTADVKRDKGDKYL